jgi:lysozyme
MSSLAPLHDMIRMFEGLRLKPYMCPAGVATIGYGSTTYPDGRRVSLRDDSITKDYAEELMQRDAAIFAAAAKALSPNLSGDKLCAIADFCYNLGSTRYKGSTLRKRVDAEDWNGAALEIGKWVMGGGKKLPGLVIRRVAEAELLLK